MNKRQLCSPEHPMPKDAAGRWEHESATEILDMGETRWMACPDCGIKWKEEVAQ